MKKLLLLSPLVFAYACGQSATSDVQAIETQVYLLKEKVAVSDEINDLLTAAAQGSYNLKYLSGFEKKSASDFAFGLTKFSESPFLSDDSLLIKKNDVIRFDVEYDADGDYPIMYEGVRVGKMEMRNGRKTVTALCTNYFSNSFSDVCKIKYDSIQGFSIELIGPKEALEGGS